MRRRSCKGFTLLEMLVVLAIICIVVSISFPITRGLGRRAQLDEDTRLIAARLREGRDLALRQRLSQLVVVHLEEPGIGGPGSATGLTFPNVTRIRVTTAKGLVSGEKAVIQFFPDGGSTGGLVEIFDGDLARRIRVDWLTGSVTTELRSSQ